LTSRHGISRLQSMAAAYRTAASAAPRSTAPL
jgi:hypothetical protein